MSFSDVVRVLVVFGSVVVGARLEAQLRITSPNNSQVAQCGDYATEVLKDPWDFSESTDIPQSIKPQQYQGFAEPLSFASGIFQTTAVSDNPYFSLLTGQSPGSIPVPDRVRYGSVFPIDSSRYRTASVRMYTDQDSFLQVFWAQPGELFAITDPVPVYGGQWRTYTVDLATFGINDHSPSGPYQWSAGNPVGLRLDPTAKNGAQVKIDWMSLTQAEATCPQVNVNYVGTNNVLTSLFVDDNQNLGDGFHQMQLVRANGQAQTTQFSTARLFRGSYYVYGFEHTDFATLHGLPWDMDSSADVSTNQVYNLTGTSFNNGRYCATTASDDGNFYLKMPPGTAIDASTFKYITVKVSGLSSQDTTFPNVVFHDQNGAVMDQFVGSFDVATSTLRFDLSSNPKWSDKVYRLRIQPTKTLGKSFCVDWVSVTPTMPNSFSTEPAIPTLVDAPGPVTIVGPTLGAFVQPDIRGGLDCPTAYLGNPWTFGEQKDVQGLSNVQNASFYPYNSITDSRGGTRIGDFLGGNAVVGSDDPKVHPLLFSSALNADKCVHFCYSLLLDRTPELYHSVARVTYLSTDGKAQDGDDIVNPDRWSDSDVCLYMKELQQEPALPAGVEHPWKGEIDFLSLDPHEDRDGTRFYIDYVELREDHKANGQFAIVVAAPLGKEVRLYASESKPTNPNALPVGAKQIGTLAAGRNTNTYLWNTAGEGSGRRYISMEVTGNGVVHAPLWVVLDGSFSDSVPPTVMIDSPVSGKKVTSSLQIAGAVFDDVRHAVTEVFIDDQYMQGIVPNQFHKAARENYPTKAPDKSGFNLFVDLSAYGNGTHTLKLRSYDTAGNVTTTTIPFEKGVVADADFSYPDPLATPVPFGELPKKLVTKVVSGNNVVFDATGYEGCTSTAIVAGKRADLSDAVTLTNGMGSLVRTAVGVKQWTFGGAVSSVGGLEQFIPRSRAATLGLQCKKGEVVSRGKCVKRCKKGLKRQVLRTCRQKLVRGKRVRVCSTTVRCVKPKTPATPTPTPVPSLEDGVIYFEARCNGAAPSNRVSINFGTEVTSPTTTIYETDILADLQAKLSS